MDEELIQNTFAYGEQHQLIVAERLGFGIHGIIHVAEGNPKAGRPGRTALKAHRNLEPYRRECAAYLRLRAALITDILGFRVPQLIRADANLRIIEMTIVTRPFLLDFAGAWLDVPPDFSDEIWSEWEQDKLEQFGSRWATVQAVLGFLEERDIHLIDVSPSNISFLD
ncbi:MAG TPA: hypothetical protein VJS65_16955 [Verrucomicrobiae bacterium]|nr:hypothetical protein [Verrucomicrobiae bacterium]